MYFSGEFYGFHGSKSSQYPNADKKVFLGCKDLIFIIKFGSFLWFSYDAAADGKKVFLGLKRFDLHHKVWFFFIDYLC